LKREISVAMFIWENTEQPVLQQADLSDLYPIADSWYPAVHHWQHN